MRKVFVKGNRISSKKRYMLLITERDRGILPRNRETRRFSDDIGRINKWFEESKFSYSPDRKIFRMVEIYDLEFAGRQVAQWHCANHHAG